MTLNTKHFGELKIEEEKILTFEEGILGFEDKKKYILLSNEEKSAFFWLQSIEDEGLAFAIVNPFMFYPEYTPEIPDTVLEAIGELKQEDLGVYTILVIPENQEEMTTNLKAPIVINTKTQKGAQAVVENAEYDIRHYIYKDTKAVV